MTKAERQEVRTLAYHASRLGDFVWRPDLNAPVIKEIDRISKRLYELAEGLIA